MTSTEPSGLSVAILGAMSTVALEVRRSLGNSSLAVGRVSLYEKKERDGTLTEFDGEAMVVKVPDREAIGMADLSFICGEDDPRSAEYLDWIAEGRGSGIDLVGASRRRPGVPMIHSEVNPGDLEAGTRLVSVPHPMAHPMIKILHELDESFGLRECCATLMRPVSDHGKQGVEELHQQTINVLNFAEVPRQVFGRQIAFNVFPLSVQGEDGTAVERIVREDVTRVLGEKGFDLSLRILQAPIFYGHCYLLRVSLQGAPDAGDLEDALGRRKGVHLGLGGPRSGPADLADEPGIWIAEIARDATGEGSWWIWMVSDGIRSGIAADAATLAARLAGTVTR